MRYGEYEQRLMRLIVGLNLLLLSGCSSISIVSVGECEHGIVTQDNLTNIQRVWPEASIADVLISSGCYQDKFILKKK